MKLSILIIVVLRLFAIVWVVKCGLALLAALGMTRLMPATSGIDLMQIILQFLPPIFYGIFATLAWVFAEKIARRVVGAMDSSLSFSEIKPENLYTLGFLGIGLYYALGNLAKTIHWLHYLAINRAGQAMIYGQDGLSIYEINAVIIPCVAGAALAILSPKLGAKLARSTPEPQ